MSMEKEPTLELFKLDSASVVSPGILYYLKYEWGRVEILWFCSVSFLFKDLLMASVFSVNLWENYKKDWLAQLVVASI